MTFWSPAVATSEYKFNYLRRAVKVALIARAQVIHTSKTQAVCRCEVYAADESQEYLCAVSQGTIARTGPASESEVKPPLPQQAP